MQTKCFCTVYESLNRADVSSSLSFVHYMEMIWAVRLFYCELLVQLGGLLWTVCCTQNYYPASFGSGVVEHSHFTIKFTRWSKLFKHMSDISRYSFIRLHKSKWAQLVTFRYFYSFTSAEVMELQSFSSICCAIDISLLWSLNDMLTASAEAQLCVLLAEIGILADFRKLWSLVPLAKYFVAVEYF